MKIKFPTAPKIVLETIIKPSTTPSNSEFSSTLSDIGIQFHEQIFGNIPKVEAHKEYTIETKYLKSKSPLNHVIFVGWRTIDINDKGETSARLTRYNKNDDSAALIEINLGPFVTGTSKALDKILALEDTQDSYEFRVLILPQVYVASVWLYNEENSESIFYLLEPFNDVFRGKYVLNEKVFFSCIKKLADKIGPNMLPSN